MGKIDIKALARELKAGPSSPASIEVKSDSAPADVKPSVRKSEKKRWSVLLTEIQNRKDLNSDGCVYIDSDLFDVLRQLKLNTGLKIGFLVSSLVEQFILENKADIRKSLQPKSNRYLVK